MGDLLSVIASLADQIGCYQDTNRHVDSINLLFECYCQNYVRNLDWEIENSFWNHLKE